MAIDGKISFGRYTRELDIHLDKLSYNAMVPPIDYDAKVDEKPYRPASIAEGRGDLHRLF